MNFLPSPNNPGFPALALQAETPAAGFPLVNATPVILQWKAPGDGKLHHVFLSLAVVVTTLEAGGLIQASLTLDGQGFGESLVNANAAPGLQPNFFGGWCIDPGSTFEVIQGSALTAGAATLYAGLFGA
jgi:hypothetical protein